MSKNRDAQFDVFLSHSSRDREFTSSLATDLAESGLRVWLDQWHIRPGESFAEAIDEAIKASQFLLIVMSPDYFKSPWTQQEWQYALGSELETKGIRLIPILYRDCDIPPLLRSKQWADFRNPDQYRMSLDRLVRDLRAIGTRNAGVAVSTPSPSDVPKVGERVDELDSKSLLALQQSLKEAIEAFRTKPKAELTTADENMQDDLCFVVMPFSVESLNIVYEDFVKPTLADECKLQVVRGDDVFGSNVIMDDISDSIRRARLIVADLTGRNANVFYEVGIAHALNKQVLLMTQSIDDVPFDLRHRRALVYEYSPRGCKKLEKDLFDNVRSMLQHPKMP